MTKFVFWCFSFVRQLIWHFDNNIEDTNTFRLFFELKMTSSFSHIVVLEFLIQDNLFPVDTALATKLI